jgi:RND family efflux transporter MFP subunit
MRTRLILFALLLASGVAAGDGLETVVVEYQRMGLEHQVDGVVEARRQATLSAQVAGEIEEVNFDVDDYVEKGAVVLRIRDREYRAGVEQARAALDEARANLREAQLEFDRNQDLRKKNLISQAQFDRAKANLEAADAREASAEASLARAEELLGYTVVKAPYSGIVVERHVEPGESTAPGRPIMSGYARGELRVTANVPQSLIADLRARRQVRVIVLEDGQSIDIDDITIHPFANQQNHSFPVRLELPRRELPLYPGMLVKVALTIGETERLLVPQSALVSRSEVNAVYVVDADGRVGMRQVRPGNRFDDRVEILSGLEAGETIALDPIRAAIEYKQQQAAAG